jgi:HSP20 family protein
VGETDSEIRVTADIPGADPDNIYIDAHDDQLEIRGTVEKEVREEKPYRYERSYGEFQRRLTLPASIQEDKVRATYKNGVLSIILPKMEKGKKSRIRIEKE